VVEVELGDEPVRDAEQLTVDVDLALVPRAVARPHRPAVPPACQVPELALGEIPMIG